MKVYIISEVNLTNFSSKVISAYSNKFKAKKRVDELNSSLDEDSSLDYELRSFELDCEDIYD